MSIKICPRCQRRFTYSKTNKDFVHKCDSQNTTLDNEDVPRLGKYVDDNGNTVPVFKAFRQGKVNNLWGTRSDIEGADSEDITSRGVRTSTHRTRKHDEYIDL